jgi:hypothetical protein
MAGCDGAEQREIHDGYACRKTVTKMAILVVVSEALYHLYIWVYSIDSGV